MRNQDSTFLHQAAEALINESQYSDIDPVINELLDRLDISNSKQLKGLDLNNLTDIPRSKNEYFSKALDVFRDERTDEPPSELADLNRYAITSRPDSSPPSKVKIEKTIQNKNTGITHEKGNSLKVDSKEERSYKCNDCPLAFFRSSDLRRHEKIHLPVFPNVCAQCGKGFARKDALKRHHNTLACKRNRNKLLCLQLFD